MKLNTKYFLLWYFFFSVIGLYGQNYISYFDHSNTFQKKAEQFLIQDQIEELIAYVEIFIAEKRDPKELAFANFYLGEAHLLLGNFIKSKNNFGEALLHFNQENHSTGLAATHLKLGNIAFYEGFMEEAEKHYSFAYDLEKEIDIPQIQYEIGQNWATIYSNQQNFEGSMTMLKVALEASKALKPEKASLIYNQISTNYHSIGELDSAIFYFEKLLELKNSVADTSGLISDLSALGNLYSELGDHVQAQDHLVNALGKAEQLQDTFSLMSLYTDISKVYSAQGIWTKATEYALKGIDMARAKGIEFIEAQNLKNYGFILEQKGETNAALDQYHQALDLFKALNNPLNLVDIQLRIGELLQDQQDFASAKGFLEEALNIRTQNNDKMGVLDSKVLLGELELKQKKYRQSIQILESCIDLATELDNKNALMKIYQLLGAAHSELQQYQKALGYFTQHNEIKYSLLQVNNIREVNKIEAQFQSAKKDKEIAQQRAELEQQKAKIQQRNYQNALLIAGLIIFMLLAGSFYFFNYKNKQINRQKIEVLTKEKETQRLKAILEGEENERRRIARELHDGLGASLATVKMQINAVSTKFPDIKNHSSYLKAENLIDDACQNVREISHNMMPTILEEHGLEHALGNVCEKFAHAYKIDIEFIPFGLEQNIDKGIQIAIFRITQELLKNIVKHAQAQEVIVQLTAEDQKLNLIVEDDGIGFEPKDLLNKDGIGLQNIRSRAEYLNGQIDIVSNKGEGTTFTIDIPL